MPPDATRCPYQSQGDAPPLTPPWSPGKSRYAASHGPRAQPGDVADVLPHETANGWLRLRLDSSAARVPKLWEETPAQFAKRLADVNETCDAGGLCRSFPKRLADLQKAKGDRPSH